MPITVKIDVTKILKEHLFQGAKGKYLNIVLFETPDDQYGNDFRAIQDLTKEARAAGERGPILGNAKHFGNNPHPQSKPPVQRKPPVDPDLDGGDQDIPF